MKVGSLVKRKSPWKHVEYSPQEDRSGIGIVVSVQMGGRNPIHLCATVIYPKKNRKYEIAVSLLEVISESR